jgi:hypothetical protein
MHPALKRCCPFLRTLHIYLSLAAFTLLFVFTLTGWMMVHQDALGLNQTRTTEESVSFADTPALLEPVNRMDLLIRLELSGRLVENEPGFFQLESPGTAVWVEISRTDQRVTVIRETRGLSGRLFDLHRNRNTGVAATWMQDLTAFLFLTVSLSGLLIWLPLHRRRGAGLLAVVAGLLGTLAWVVWG